MASHICSHCGGLVVEGQPITAGRITVLAPSHCRAVVGDAVVLLTDTEARLLYVLAQRAPSMVPKDDLFDLVWPGDSQPSTRKIIDIIVHNVRDKFDVVAKNGRRLILTEYGKGVGLDTGA